MQFKTEYKGYTLVFSEYNPGQIQISELDESYPNSDAAIARIDKYETALRKSFTNNRAKLYGYYDRTLNEVTVTSVTDCKTEAWVVDSKGRRSKQKLTALFPVDSDAPEKALAELELMLKRRDEIWAAVPRWKPEFKAESK